jgi:hypothetical protein
MGPPVASPAARVTALGSRESIHGSARLRDGVHRAHRRHNGKSVPARCFNIGRANNNRASSGDASSTSESGLLRVVSHPAVAPVADTVAANPVVGLGLTAAVGVAAAVATTMGRGGGGTQAFIGHNSARAATSRAARADEDYVTFSFDAADDGPGGSAPSAVDDDPVRDPASGKPPPFPSLPDRSNEEQIDVSSSPPPGPSQSDSPVVTNEKEVKATTIYDEEVAKNLAAEAEEEARFEAALAQGGRSDGSRAEENAKADAKLKSWKKTVGDDAGVVPSFPRPPTPLNPIASSSEPNAVRNASGGISTGAEEKAEWWDVDIDDEPYRAAPPRKKKPADVKSQERRRAARRKNRISYLRNNSSVRRGSPGDQARSAEVIRARLDPAKSVRDR